MNNQLSEIYTQLFVELGYSQHDKIPNYFSNDESNSFYVCTIINDNELDNWFLEQKSVFDSVMEIQANPHRVKNNTSHLVFYITEEENKNFVFELEEDEYYFKKNVIVLNRGEIKDFENHFHDSKFPTYRLFLENTVDSHNLFEIYKNHGNKDFYSMILKLYIKIPSLYLSKSVSSNELQTLKDLIEKKLIEEELFGFTNQLNEDIDKYLQSGKELKNIDVDTVLDIWIGENNYEK
ncbi:ABC-three component system middle component 1 [Enterococcus plantarum]|uniref:ABC-three component system middle component 1 n=1 Tax=Enterococcus plantarum TaxID=1077675 RepID=UPI001A901EF2|nr:ABC-three component system middle component 1 [Enterococcus plantarum]MBO0422184.1 hypothetical protein [Enterococcus plantarum]